ncbi:MAG TPA: hypothetical protein VK817_02555 [Trebonia sp.]|jgi:hypothetical protein|nr:hypothetical protein [Trebonia sp.]
MAGQGFNDRAKARQQQRAEAVLAAAGYPESVQAGLRGESGPSRWWILLSTYITLFKKYYFVGLTERNVVLLSLSIWTGRPKKIKSVTPREQVSITDFNPGTMWGSFRFMTPDRAKPLKLRFAARIYRKEAEEIARALAFGMPAPSQ